MLDNRLSRDALVHATKVHFSMPWLVRFQDIDAAGIVFFAKIIEFCHDAYIQFWLQKSHLFREAVHERRWIFPLVHAEADFLQPLRFGDWADVQLIHIEVTARKLHIGYRVVRRTDAQVVAVAQTIHVVVEGGTFQRVDVPREVVDLLKEYAE